MDTMMDAKAETLRDIIQAVDAHDLDRVRSHHAPDGQIRAPGVELQGVDQIMSWYQVFVTAFPDIKHEVRATIEHGNACVLEARVTGTHTGPLASPAGEIAPTGKRFALDYVNVARFADGRLTRETYYWDNQSFLTQLGLL
jgi:steroid delta-isomerase-like uncharacterized protein